MSWAQEFGYMTRTCPTCEGGVCIVGKPGRLYTLDAESGEHHFCDPATVQSVKERRFEEWNRQQRELLHEAEENVVARRLGVTREEMLMAVRDFLTRNDRKPQERAPRPRQQSGPPVQQQVAPPQPAQRVQPQQRQRATFHPFS